MIHPLSDVQSTQIGAQTRVWQYFVMLPGAKIGDHYNICSHCFIENDVTIGDRVTIKCGVQIWDGLTIEDDVFIGPNVTFTNDALPRSRIKPDSFLKTTIMKNSSIGANATILPGINIGRASMVGAGAVVTKSVPDFAIVVGTPANGLAQAFVIGKDFIGDDSVALILGDNIFYGSAFGQLIRQFTNPAGAAVYAAPVGDPERLGVVVFNSDGAAISIVEKPTHPKSSYAVPGLYVYDNSVIEIAKAVRPSDRGELEITSVIQAYLDRGDLRVEVLGRGHTWLDTGTHDSLLEASLFVRTIEKHQGFQVACLEEIGFKNGWIDVSQLRHEAEIHGNSGHRDYLYALIESASPNSKSPTQE